MTTPRPWIACDWDPMEQPHLYHSVEEHNHGHDVARGMTADDARFAEFAVNNIEEVVRLLRTARQHWDAGSIDSNYDAMAGAFDAIRAWLYEHDPETQAGLT